MGLSLTDHRSKWWEAPFLWRGEKKKKATKGCHLRAIIQNAALDFCKLSAQWKHQENGLVQCKKNVLSKMSGVKCGTVENQVHENYPRHDADLSSLSADSLNSCRLIGRRFYLRKVLPGGFTSENCICINITNTSISILFVWFICFLRNSSKQISGVLYPHLLSAPL